jgi:hypothetical protein
MKDKKKPKPEIPQPEPEPHPIRMQAGELIAHSEIIRFPRGEGIRHGR